MSISDKVRKSLEKIGLTSYEIRTYTSLINSGELNASELSNKSGVPYSKIYEVLGTLEEKGWISSDESRPTKYIAKSPTTALETTKQNVDTEFSNNQNKILTELIPLYEKSGTSEKPDIWFISGAMNIVSKIMEMVENCRKEVMIAVPQAGEEIVKQALPKLRQLHDKGIEITILTSDSLAESQISPTIQVFFEQFSNSEGRLLFGITGMFDVLYPLFAK